MRESDMRQIVVKALAGLDAISVENPARPGTPDVNYVEGWIELKYLPSWPARATTPVKIKCFTPQQRVWLQRRCRRGGSAFFLVRVANDWLLFDGATAAKMIGVLTKEEMFGFAILHCGTTLRTNDLIRVLKTWSTKTEC
jgi:hypothetical protein